MSNRRLRWEGEMSGSLVIETPETKAFDDAAALRKFLFFHNLSGEGIAFDEGETRVMASAGLFLAIRGVEPFCRHKVLDEAVEALGGTRRLMDDGYYFMPHLHLFDFNQALERLIWEFWPYRGESQNDLRHFAFEMLQYYLSEDDGPG